MYPEPPVTKIVILYKPIEIKNNKEQIICGILGSPIFILKAHNVVLTQVRTRLYFNEL